ncbi:MAG: hypothetical protein K9J82_04545 [Methylotenera sp.]|jgi:hypothetical protein|nr:hypothetical protein [Methylotenera sp.]
MSGLAERRETASAAGSIVRIENGTIGCALPALPASGTSNESKVLDVGHWLALFLPAHDRNGCALGDANQVIAHEVGPRKEVEEISAGTRTHRNHSDASVPDQLSDLTEIWPRQVPVDSAMLAQVLAQVDHHHRVLVKTYPQRASPLWHMPPPLLAIDSS